MPGPTVPVSTAVVAAHTIGGSDAEGFDARWSAWKARGVAHEQAVRRRMWFAVPVLLVGVGAFYLYAVL